MSYMEEVRMSEKKIAIYCRVSSKDQAMHGYGLDAQKEKCLQFLQLYEYDKNEYELYVDDGYSAKSLDRPRMKDLLNDVHNKKINMIIVYKLDRLARSVVDTYHFIQELISYDCQLIAVIDRLDIDSANGRMIVGMLAVFAQWEREVIIERTKDGLESMVAKGKYPYGGSPFGWNKDENLHLSINEDEAKIVNDLADQSLSGLSLIQIKKYLKETYGMNRNECTILKWMTRSINQGNFVFHENTYTNVVPAIMTEQKYKKVCSSIGRHSSIDNTRYLFHNKVYCKCGSKCQNKSTNKKIGQNVKRYFYYACPSCGLRMNENKILEQIVVSLFMRDSKKSLDLATKKKKDKLDNIRIKISEMYKRYINDEIDVIVYSDTIKKLNASYEIISNQILGLDIDSMHSFKEANKIEKKAYIDEFISHLTVDVGLQLVVNIEWKEK